MPIKQRKYTGEPGFTDDFMKVHEFLQRIYEPFPNGNWLWNRWQWMFSLPYLDETKLSRIGIWEDNGSIIALACYEQGLGDAYLVLDKKYGFLKKELLEYSIEHLKVVRDGISIVKATFSSLDGEFREIADELGFINLERPEKTAIMEITPSIVKYILPAGYSIVSLDQENDYEKIDRVLWKGFNHTGPSPENSIEEKKKSQAGPHFNKEITIAVNGPDAEYVSYCGMWYDPKTDYAIVEPMATIPEYRRKGLGKASVLEGIKRCWQMGAKIAYVGSGQQFYYSVGFKPFSENDWWQYTCT
jgi:predicted N-acetyltransferase YhbS